MTRYLRVSLIAVIALAVMLAVTPTPASARVFVRGGWYGWHGGWGWGWGPGWYGPAWWGPGYYYGPPAGTVKIDTPDRAAAVYIDGGYAGIVADMHKFSLRPGVHDITVRAPNGQQLFNQRVEVLRGKTTKIHVGA